MISGYKFILIIFTLMFSVSQVSLAEPVDKNKPKKTTKSIDEMTADELEAQVREKVAAELKNKKVSGKEADAYRERFEKNAEEVRNSGQYGTPILSDSLIVSLAKSEYSSNQEVDNFNPLLNKVYPTPPYKNIKNKLYSQQEYSEVVKYLEEMKIANCDLKHSGRIDYLRDLTTSDWTPLQKMRLYQIMKDIGLYSGAYNHKPETLARCPGANGKPQNAPKSGYEFSKVALIYAMSIHPLKSSNRGYGTTSSGVTEVIDRKVVPERTN